MNINGKKIENTSIIKAEDIFFYEGKKEHMFIYKQSNGNTYEGQVNDLDYLEQHGRGL